MTPLDYSSWTTEALIEYEQRLFDDEIAGNDVWVERDQVLWELAYRTRAPNRPSDGR